MKTHIISYDLRIPETSEDYTKIIGKIKSLGGWATPLKSVWFVTTTQSTSEIRDELKFQTDWNDGLIVIEITNADWASKGIDSKVTEWMKNNL